MKKILSLFLVLFIFQHHCIAQDQHLIDSLEKKLKSAKQDTTKANILYELSKANWYTKPDEAIEYAKQSMTLSEQLGFKKGTGYAYYSMGVSNVYKGDQQAAMELTKKAQRIGEEISNRQLVASTYVNIGVVYMYLGNNSEALPNLFRAKEIAEKIKDKQIIIWSYVNIANIYLQQGKYTEAIKIEFTCLKLEEELGNKIGIASSNSNIAYTYTLLGNYPEALKYQFAALRIEEKTGDKLGMAGSYCSIGMIYDNLTNYQEALKNYSASLKFYQELKSKEGIADILINIGETYRKQGNYYEALKNYLESNKIYAEIGVNNSTCINLSNIGLIYSMQGNYPEALKNSFAALKIAESREMKEVMSYTNVNIGNIYTKMKRYTEASQYLQKGLSLAKEIGSLDVVRQSYNGLASLDQVRGNFEDALKNYKLFITYRDSLVNKENTKKVTQLQMQYDFDNKESQAKAEQYKKDVIAQEELHRQKLMRNGFVAGFAVMLLFAVIFLQQRNKISKSKKRSDELLLNILPEEVAEELKEKGSADAKQIDEVTVLFTDFKGFTAYSETLTPRELVKEIHNCFSAFDHIMEKYGMEKIKTIGDSYMAAGGLPIPNKTHAEDAIKAALEIQMFIEKGKAQKLVTGAAYFEARIGIHTGPVVAGIVGVKKFAYDIWGDTVNIASRMESSGEAGKINISQTTYELVKDKFNCTYRGKIQAKGKGEVDMYFVENIL